MNITDIKIRRTFNDTKLKAIVSITIDGVFAIHDIKIIKNPEHFIIAMPSYRDGKGISHDIVHPITSETRKNIEKQILSAYFNYIENNE